MNPTKLIKTLKANGWNFRQLAGEFDLRTGHGFGVEDISGLWRVSVWLDRVTLMGPMVTGGGFPIAQFAEVEQRTVYPFGWATTVAAILNSHGFTIRLTTLDIGGSEHERRGRRMRLH